MQNLFVCLLAVGNVGFIESFGLTSRTGRAFTRIFAKASADDGITIGGYSELDNTVVAATSPEVAENPVPIANIEKASDLKRQLYQLAASYDRGFGATPKAREEANDIIQQLAVITPTKNAARGIEGDGFDDDVPLKGIWRMVWTSALDVVSLAASPIAAPSAIYQVIDPPIATNIIDFIPRAQSFFPPSIAPPSLLRAEVLTRGYSRNGKPDRVGLVFEGLKLQPVELLGQKVDGLPPLSVDLTWPSKVLAPFVPGMMDDMEASRNDADALGYFDIEYVDEELLVIKQQGGGRFALVKVDSSDP